MKMKLFTLIMLTIAATLATFAQVDTTAIIPTVSSGNILVNFVTNPPEWFITLAIITGATLTATQTILMRIPTEKSIKIRGFLGSILELLAFLPTDNKKGGGTH